MEALQLKVDKLVQTVRETFSGIRVIKALSKEEYQKQKLKDANVNVVQSEEVAAKTMAVTSPIMNFILKFLRMLYFRNKRDLKPQTLICNNCLAGCVLHDYNMRFDTPTINLWIPFPDYMKFLKRLKSAKAKPESNSWRSLFR